MSIFKELRSIAKRKWLDALLRKEALECVVSIEHRNMVVKGIGGDWESLATFIGIPPGDIEDIKEEHKRPLGRRLAVMRKWHKLCGKMLCMYLRLVKGLRQIGRKDLIESVLLQLCKCKQSAESEVATMPNTHLQDGAKHQQPSVIPTFLPLAMVLMVIVLYLCRPLNCMLIVMRHL